MVQRGANHTKALAVVAAHLARRLWRVLERQTPYVVCDIDGRPVTPEQAKQVIAERYTVPEEIRRRRRASKNAAKAASTAASSSGTPAEAATATKRPSKLGYGASSVSPASKNTASSGWGMRSLIAGRLSAGAGDRLTAAG